MFNYANKMSPNYAYENKYINYIENYKTLLQSIITEHAQKHTLISSFTDHKCY